MGYSDCKYSVQGESGIICKWIELRTMCDWIIYSECRNADELHCVWKWHDNEWSWPNEL